MAKVSLSARTMSIDESRSGSMTRADGLAAVRPVPVARAPKTFLSICETFDASAFLSAMSWTGYCAVGATSISAMSLPTFW